MKERNKTVKPELREINNASLRTSYSTGTGIGPNDCMDPDFFNELNDRGVLSDTIYVCGQGWTIPGAFAIGSGRGSGSGSGSGNYWGSLEGSYSWWGSAGNGSGDSVPKRPVELMDTSKFVPWDESNCLTLCQKVLRNYGLTSYGDSNHIIRVTSSGSGTIKPWGNDPAQSLKNAIECIDKHLDANRVIIVGVEHSLGYKPNKDGTDHYIVITGRHYDSYKQRYYYTFMDSGTSKSNEGCSPDNRLSIEGQDFSGYTKRSGLYYTVTHVRPNDGGKYDTTSMPSKQE